MTKSTKIPFAKVSQLLTTGYSTGGVLAKNPPGQAKTPGTQRPDSVIQAASPGNTFIAKPNRIRTLIITPFIAEDPARADIMRRYDSRAIKHSLSKNEAPFPGNLLYAYLNIRDPIERDVGLQCQLAWLKGCEVVAFYVDYGVTPAMEVIMNATALKFKRIERRVIMTDV